MHANPYFDIFSLNEQKRRLNILNPELGGRYCRMHRRFLIFQYEEHALSSPQRYGYSLVVENVAGLW
jgi:hypothetical protein